MAKSVIYRLKEDIDFNKLAEIGWDVVPNNANLTFFKIIAYYYTIFIYLL